MAEALHGWMTIAWIVMIAWMQNTKIKRIPRGFEITVEAAACSGAMMQTGRA